MAPPTFTLHTMTSSSPWLTAPHFTGELARCHRVLPLRVPYGYQCENAADPLLRTHSLCTPLTALCPTHCRYANTILTRTQGRSSTLHQYTLLLYNPLTRDLHTTLCIGATQPKGF